MGHHSDERPLRDEAIARALADKGRPARDRARDKRDRIGKVLAFGSIAPAEIIADFLPFRSYYTRLFASLVGAAGRAYTVIPEDLSCIERIAKGRAEIAGFATSEPIIELASGPLAQAGPLPEPVDLFWISENYHDLHNAFMGPVDIGAFNAAVFAALKPGGTPDHHRPCGRQGRPPRRHREAAPHRTRRRAAQNRGGRVQMGRCERGACELGRPPREQYFRAGGPLPHRPIHPSLSQAGVRPKKHAPDAGA
jgi:hypothetical protein